jgi:hypothetical protein
MSSPARRRRDRLARRRRAVQEKCADEARRNSSRLHILLPGAHPEWDRDARVVNPALIPRK